MNFEQLEKAVIEWARPKGLLNKDNGRNQILKTVEELGEVVRAELKNDRIEKIDGIGDVVVTLILYANINDLSIVGCLSVAYNEIKDRTGKNINGTFIKN